MILGAFLDAGLDLNYLKKELKKLKLNHYSLIIKKVKRGLIHGTYFDVIIKGHEKHRHLNEILSLINKSKLSKFVKTLSSKIFKKLAAAEAKVHGVSIKKIHFHEVGATDAILDIVGCAIAIEKLGIEAVYASPLPHGIGTIKHAHGTLSNPAPATAELLKGIPTYGTKIKGELVTPTGAAIITTIAKDFGDLPRLKTKSVGYGAGSKIFPNLPNSLRVFIGEAQLSTKKDAILQIETNIDDMNPENYDRIIAKIMKAGALDTYITPIRMKKDRYAASLTILCSAENRDNVLEELFQQTTSLGVRIYLVPREKLSRKIVKVKTKYGKAKVKLGYLGKKLTTIAPEYEDYKQIAKKHRIPIQKAYQAVKKSTLARRFRFG